jgi:hypothetical protein
MSAGGGASAPAPGAAAMLAAIEDAAAHILRCLAAYADPTQALPSNLPPLVSRVAPSAPSGAGGALAGAPSGSGAGGSPYAGARELASALRVLATS